jgi:hypothetical protein
MDERPSMKLSFMIAAALAATLGCSSSSTAPPAGDGGSQGTVCVTVTDADKLPWSGTAPPTYLCDANKSTKYPDGPNNCRNASDCAIIASGQVREITRVCGLSCRSFEPDCMKMAECNSQCVVDTTRMKIMDPGISNACGGCYTNVALCSLAYCLSECAASADAIECVKCQFEFGCRVPFERCSGLDRM